MEGQPLALQRNRKLEVPTVYRWEWAVVELTQVPGCLFPASMLMPKPGTSSGFSSAFRAPGQKGRGCGFHFCSSCFLGSGPECTGCSTLLQVAWGIGKKRVSISMLAANLLCDSGQVVVPLCACVSSTIK